MLFGGVSVWSEALVRAVGACLQAMLDPARGHDQKIACKQAPTTEFRRENNRINSDGTARFAPVPAQIATAPSLSAGIADRTAHRRW